MLWGGSFVSFLVNEQFSNKPNDGARALMNNAIFYIKSITFLPRYLKKTYKITLFDTKITKVYY